MAEREWAGHLDWEEVCLMILTTSFIGEPLQAEEGKLVKEEGEELGGRGLKKQNVEIDCRVNQRGSEWKGRHLLFLWSLVKME